MALFDSPRLPMAGSGIKANWGKRVVESLRERQIVDCPGVRVSRLAYGTRIEVDGKSTDSEWSVAEETAFRVRWYPYERIANDKGEWQICLPYGCASVTSENLSRSYVPVNADARDSEGNKLFKWYRIEPPEDKDAEVTQVGDYFALSWTVRVLFKPWPSMKAVTGEEDESFGIAGWTVNVATINEIRRYVFKTTYLDVLPYHPEWLGDTFIQEAEEARIANSPEWRHELMGEAIGTGGEIFANAEAGEITDEQIAMFRERGWDRYGLDFGFTNDPSALVESAISPDRRTIYVYGADGGHGMFEEDLVELCARRGVVEKTIIADRAEARAIAKMRRLGCRRIRECWKSPDGWVDEGMKFLRSSRRRIIVDPRPHRAKLAWDEISRYEYARYKNGDFHTDYPDRNNHWIDALRYAHEQDIRAEYTPKQWTLPKAYQRKYADLD